MNIHVSFDDELLYRYDQRNSPSYFCIYIEVNERIYPDRSWMDFGAVILGWWQRACVELLEGNKEVAFVFMDGPYRLRLKQQLEEGKLLCLTYGDEVLGDASLAQVANEVVRAGAQVHDHLTMLQIDRINREALSIGIAKLQQYL